MSSLVTFTTYLDTKLKANSYSPAVTFNECLDLLSPNVVFPRVEIDMPLASGSSYITQRELEWAVRYRIFGYLKKEGIEDGDTSNNWTLQDRCNILDFGMSLTATCFSILDDFSSGLFECPGFTMIRSVPNLWTDLEIIPKIMICAFDFEVVMDKLDTEV